MQKSRRDRLMPGGIPRYIRCYDRPEFPDRYTVVYTRRPNYYLYVGMSNNPYHPQGIGQHGEGHYGAIDRNGYAHLGKRIQFSDLPADCQSLVLSDYKELWSIKDES